MLPECESEMVLNRNADGEFSFARAVRVRTAADRRLAGGGGGCRRELETRAGASASALVASCGIPGLAGNSISPIDGMGSFDPHEKGCDGTGCDSCNARIVRGVCALVLEPLEGCRADPATVATGGVFVSSGMVAKSREKSTSAFGGTGLVGRRPRLLLPCMRLRYALSP